MSSSNTTMSTNTINKTPSRLPAPALFVGPPSRNASNTSLLSPDAASKPTARTPLNRQRSLLGPNSNTDPKSRPLPPTSTSKSTALDFDDNHLSLTSSNPSAPFQRRQRHANEAAEVEASERAEAIWVSMQNTLEEVELSAIKGPGMTVFGSEHSRALDELRRAQIDLAKAWARSEAEESGQFVEERMSARGTDAADMLASDRATKLGGGGGRSRANSKSKSGAGDSDGGNRRRAGSAVERTRLEEETERDIELSRKRREANDRYFEKVNRGVLEVVKKLEDVARAMKGVEVESKEIWHDGDGEAVDEEGSVTTAHSGI